MGLANAKSKAVVVDKIPRVFSLETCTAIDLSLSVYMYSYVYACLGPGFLFLFFLN
jgi:hypothetical protein